MAALLCPDPTDDPRPERGRPPSRSHGRPANRRSDCQRPGAVVSVGAIVARRELRDGELEPATNRGEGSMIANTGRAGQGMVQLGHGGTRLGLPLRQLELRPLPLPWKEQLVRVTPP